MPSCFVRGCSNATYVSRLKEGVTFHKFPSVGTLKRTWLVALGKDPAYNIAHERVCSEHFVTNDFEMAGERKRLKTGTIPTLKLPHLFEVGHLEESYLPSSPSCSKLDGSDSPQSSPPKSPIKLSPLKRSNSESSSSAHSSVKLRMVQLFHPYSKAPEDASVKLKEKVRLLERQLRVCRNKLKVSKRTSRRRKLKIKSLTRLVSELKNKFSLSTQATTDIMASIQGAPAALLKRMLLNRKLGDRKVTKAKIEEQLRSFAMTLQFYSSKAYNYVRETFGFALPAPSTISSWLSKVDCSPGFTEPAISSLKIRADKFFEKNKRQLLLSLIIDEMSLKKELSSDRHTQQIFGYTDIGAGKSFNNEQELATEVLVLMVVGVNDHFKIPIGYFLINKISGAEKANIILEALRQLQQVNCKVLAVTCDGPQVNFKMLQTLGCNVTNLLNLKPYFYHPVTHQRVYVLLDVCHMLKLIRNNWANIKIIIDPNGNEVKWEYIEKLYKIQEDEGLYLGNKLRGKHLQWETAKMKVNIAAQTLSNSVADALEFLCDTLHLDEFKGVKPTIDFIRNIDKLFDLLNSRNLYGKGMKTPMQEKNEDSWKPVLENICEYLQNCKTQTGRLLYMTKKRTPFLGFIVSAKSLLSIYESEVVTKKTLDFLLTYKFSQDHLELFFCSVRSRNGWINNPNAQQFMHTYKRLLLHQDVRSNTGNCLAQDQTNILVVSSKKEKITISDIHAQRNNAEMDDVDIYNEHLHFVLPSNLGEYAENVVAYISGFVVRSLLRSRKIKCQPCAESLYMSQTDHQDTSLAYLNFINRGFLFIPSKSVRVICTAIEKKIQLIRKLSGTLLPVKDNFINILLKETTYLYDQENIFGRLEHFDLLEITDTPHRRTLIIQIIRCYGSIRLHSLTRNINFSVKGKNIRQIFNKLVIHKHQ